MDLLNLGQLVNSYLVPFGLKVGIAIVIWVVGGIAINTIVKIMRRVLTARALEPTLVNYATSAAHVALRVLLIMAILEICGIPTTSFAALIGAVGVAIGVAWSGLLSNFAAGIFLVMLRPFKVGDYINAAGQTGTVTQIGLFVTTMLTDNNVRVIIGNNKLFSDTITNYSANPVRRADLRCQIAYGVDPAQAIALLLARVRAIPNVLENPAPGVAILEFNASGTMLAIRVNALTANFGQVYNDTNNAIAETCAAAGWPAPATYQVSVASVNSAAAIPAAVPKPM